MVSLVSVTLQDGRVLENIHATCFPDAWDKAAFEVFLKDPTTCGWMAVSLKGSPVGFILARILREEAEILTFSVIPSFQNKGIGGRLLKELLAFLGSVDCVKIFLEVAIDNKAAIKLYEAVGFKPVATRPNYYYSRIDHTRVSAFLMEWTKDDSE